MTVRTLSSQPAVLQVTTDEVIGARSVMLENGAIVTSPEREPIGDFLEVLPRVNNDNTIDVVLRPSVSTLERGAPSERTILTEAVINSGDTIVIGGVETEKETVQRSQSAFGIPLSKKSKNQERQVMMFLTAKIVE
jgi:type II secretory pathway component GspD/PulD (secretin)